MNKLNRLFAFILIATTLFFQVSTFAQQSTGSSQKTIASVAPDATNLGDLDDFINKQLDVWKVPGLAVAIVQDGKVILSKGYGWRDVKNKKPVTSKTLFAIGSSTKSFTVTSLASLVRQGKLEWDKPVREYLPDFKLYDPTATEHMTPRDLVTHRSGLPRHDFMWYNSPLTREELFKRLRYLEPNKDFRSTFQYQNLMFMTAGYLAGRVANTTWEETVRKNIFTPLSMSSSNFSITDMQKSADYSLPYQKDPREEVRDIPFRPIDEVGPAGSINSNVEDMIRYVQMHLNKGKFEAQQVLSAADVNDMQTPQMVIPGALNFAEVGHTQYGMGFFITSYRGNKLVHHGGNIDGFTALVSFMPNSNIGLVILSNLNGTPLPQIISYNIYDRLLKLDQVAWSDRLKDQEAKTKASQDESNKRGLSPRKMGTKPSHDIKEYVGEYEHPAYGVVKIDRDGGDLRIAFHDFSAPLVHFHYDVFLAHDKQINRLEGIKVQFKMDIDGDISSLSVPFEPAVKDIIFTRMADHHMFDKAFLEGFAGQYQLGPTTITVALREDNTLVLTIPGQTPYDLVPFQGSRFRLKGMNGYNVEFNTDKSGKTIELVFFQPNGATAAKRK